MKGPDRDLWNIANGDELIKLIVDRKILVPIHPQDQPVDQRRFTTYYNPQVKEKLDDNGAKTQRVRGTFGGNKPCAYTGPTSSPVADVPSSKFTGTASSLIVATSAPTLATPPSISKTST